MKKVRPRPLRPIRLPDSGEDGRRSSRDRMILTLQPDADLPQVEALLAEKELTVLYRMKSGSVLTVRAARPLTARAWAALARELEQSEWIAGVSRDGINELHASGPQLCEKCEK
ncbi:MAG: hypothetical protein IJT76_09375 [Clostridia bacterium]|nr:hypothetical protein [Clostridia bacterium]